MKPNPAFQRAMIHVQQGRHADAERELRGVLAQDPHDALAHAYLSLTLSETKQYQPATDEAEAAVGLAPDLPLAHYARAKVLLDRHYLNSAADAIHEAIRLDARDPDHFALLAAIRLEQRRWGDALASADEGLRHDPEHQGCVNLRSVALVQLGRREEAGAAIGAALARDPENAHTHANQGWALLHQGDAPRALVHFRESLRLEPDNDWARAGMVEALKARYLVYRLVLRYFLWMSRLSSGAQWGIMIGGWVGYQVLRQVAAKNPALGTVLWPILIAYIGFVMMTWLSVPFFNLLLRLNRFGRFALSREQTITSNLIAVLLLGAVGCLVWWVSTSTEAALGGAIVSALLIVPTSVIFNCSAGWPRWTMAGIAVALALTGIGSVALDLTANARQSPELLEQSQQLFRMFAYGTLFASIGSQYLVNAKPKQRRRRRPPSGTGPHIAV